MITVSELSKIVSADKRTMSGQVTVIRIHWCRKMIAGGRCNMPCSTSACANHLKEVISGIRVNEARNPTAVLIWRIRNEISNVEEKTEAPSMVFDKLLGTPAKQNAFENILSEIGGN